MDLFEHNKNGMSPIVVLAMAAVRVLLGFVAMLLGLIMAVFVWQKHTPQGFAFAPGDWAMVSLISILFVVSWWLRCAVKREIEKN